MIKHKIIITLIFMGVSLFFINPVFGEILEYSDTDIKIYSHVNNSWDYSTRYEINTIQEVESNTDYSYLGSGSGYVLDCNYYEHVKPTQLSIDFNINNNLKSIFVTSKHTVTPDFIEGTLFHLMNGSDIIGYGSFFMWADPDDKLVYYYELDYLEDIHEDTHIYDIVYTDDSIFNSIDFYSVVVVRELHIFQNVCCDIIPLDGGVYLLSNHYVHYRDASNGRWYINDEELDEMATINILENFYISKNDIYYYYNIDSYIGYVEIDNIQSSYKIGLTRDLFNESNETSNNYYINDTNYRSTDQEHNNNRLLGVKIDLYVNPTLNYPEYTFILDYGGDELPNDNGYFNYLGVNTINFNPDVEQTSTFPLTVDLSISDQCTGLNQVMVYRDDVYIHSYQLGSTQDTSILMFELIQQSYNCTYMVKLLTLPCAVVASDSIEYIYDESGIPPFPTPDPTPDITPLPTYTPPPTPIPPDNPITPNNTLNNSWYQGYISIVNNCVNGLFSPIYNATAHFMYPTIVLTNTGASLMIESEIIFDVVTEKILIATSMMSIFFNCLPDKLIYVMIYYLLWLTILLVFKGAA